MDVVIGRIPPPGGPSDKSDTSRGQIEARVLHVRAPRRPKRRGEQEGGHDSGERRGSASATTDPAGARVLVLLVPDAHRLPEDLAGGPYRLFLRVVRK